ncbi:MAG TPA: FMN-binding negative transcriptional regulator [Casimicrobiaceae bacterium]|jgi:transcriptional regulator
MTVYIPDAFAIAERAAIRRLIDEYPFVTLITPAGPEPYVTHIPLLTSDDGTVDGALIGHFARANPHWQQVGGVESTAIFHGPHAYVSPSWYEQPAQAVPTWNFTAVHVHGVLEIFDDPAETRGVLDALIERFEGHRPAPWKLALPHRQRDAMIGAIVAFKMPIRRIEAKFKLSQNRSRNDRVRVIAALDAEGYSEATQTAAWMRAYADADDERSR